MCGDVRRLFHGGCHLRYGDTFIVPQDVVDHPAAGCGAFIVAQGRNR
jgi:hypothetical protein